MASRLFSRQTACVNRQALFYLDTKSDLPVIVCLHGRFGRGETWLDFARRYYKRYRIIAPDQRGHGLSSKPIGNYSAEEMADDIAALVTHCDCEQLIVVGHSMGARVAGYFATQHPGLVSALVLLDHSPFAGRPRPSRKSLNEIPQLDAFTATWPLPFASRVEASEFIMGVTKSVILTGYLMGSLIETVDGYSVMFSRQAVSAIYEYQHAWSALFADIQCPVMSVRAKGSNQVSDVDWAQIQMMASRNQTPHAILELNTSDHHLYLSNSENFYRGLDQFLDGI